MNCWIDPALSRIEPPRRSAVGVRRAEIAPSPSAPRRGTSTARHRGLRYEGRVLSRLRSEIASSTHSAGGGSSHGFLLGPWISFDDARGEARLCQPDALWLYTPAAFGGDAAASSVFGEKQAAASPQMHGPRPSPRAVIFEVKYSHSRDAWHQLRELYQPVLSRLVPDIPIEVVEVTRYFDPAVPLPEECVLLSTPAEALALRGRFGILSWT